MAAGGLGGHPGRPGLFGAAGLRLQQGGKGCRLTASVIDVSAAVHGGAHAERLPTAGAAPGEKRKRVDLGVSVTKC